MKLYLLLGCTMAWHDSSLEQRLEQTLQAAIRDQDLPALTRALELVEHPRFERQAVVRTLLNASGDTALPGTIVAAVIDQSWFEALPLLVQAGARLDLGTTNEPTIVVDACGDVVDVASSAYFSSVHTWIDRIHHRDKTQPPFGERDACTLETLLRLGAKTNGLTAIDEDPLHRVCMRWTVMDDGRGALIQRVLQALLDHGADPNRELTIEGCPLRTMVEQRMPSACFHLILDAGASPWQVDPHRHESPYVFAQRIGSPTLLQVMAQREHVTLRDVAGTTEPLEDSTTPSRARPRL